ncbi:hypothetical protein [Thalassobacillus devorans]|uniref:hypothetical protein n=1 Tax=Thalassobacillus devorans TaxID=279813 RepID=UPI00048EEC2A|nr:hypothetical protein [Thalassobacillus devorans]
MGQKNMISWMFVSVGIINALTGAVMWFVINEKIISFIFIASSVIFLLAGRVAWSENHGEEAKD